MDRRSIYSTSSKKAIIIGHSICYDADTICQRVTSRVRQGSIVLFHNAALHTPEALPAILTCLINDGYTVVPISQLILPQPYTIDHTGRQFPAETGA